MDGNKSKILLIVPAQHNYVRSVMNEKVLKTYGDVTVLNSTASNYVFRAIHICARFMFMKKNDFNVIVVSFLAQPMIPFIRLFWKRKLVCDAYVSLYDTLCLDRKRFDTDSFIGKLIKRFEQWSLRLADHLLTDTNVHASFYTDFFNIPSDKITTLYLGAPEQFYGSFSESDTKHARIFYYGAGNPLQGIDTILRAASQLKDSNIGFTIVGPIRSAYSDLISELELDHVSFIDWLPFDELPDAINAAHICLGGQFGTTRKAYSVIAGKTYQFAAMGKALILGDNAANKEIFTNETDCIMVPMGDSQALADAIQRLSKDPTLRNSMARSAWERVRQDDVLLPSLPIIQKH